MKIARKASISADLDVIPAKQGIFNVHYRTLSTPSIRVRFRGFLPPAAGGEEQCLLERFEPMLNEWSPVKVPATYLLRKIKEGEQMPTATSAKTVKGKNSVKALGASGMSVYGSWGKLFQTHGAKPNAPELIAAGMAKEFPGRKTDWAKWVNSVRSLYNRGDKRLGVPAPATALKSYKAAAGWSACVGAKPAPATTGMKTGRTQAKTPNKANTPKTAAK